MENDAGPSVSQSKSFYYNSIMTASLAILTTFLFIFVLFMIYIYVKKGDVYGEVIFYFLFIGPILFLRATISRVSISLDDDGIIASIFGITTKKIGWSQVQKIRKIRIYSGSGYVDMVDIFDGKHNFICAFFVNFCGNIAFTQRIHGFRSLLDCINVYARQYQIPLTVMDPRVTAARISEDPKPGRWQRGAARSGEERVAEF